MTALLKDPVSKTTPIPHQLKPPPDSPAPLVQTSPVPPVQDTPHSVLSYLGGGCLRPLLRDAQTSGCAWAPSLPSCHPLSAPLPLGRLPPHPLSSHRTSGPVPGSGLRPDSKMPPWVQPRLFRGFGHPLCSDTSGLTFLELHPGFSPHACSACPRRSRPGTLTSTSTPTRNPSPTPPSLPAHLMDAPACQGLGLRPPPHLDAPSLSPPHPIPQQALLALPSKPVQTLTTSHHLPAVTPAKPSPSLIWTIKIAPDQSRFHFHPSPHILCSLHSCPRCLCSNPPVLSYPIQSGSQDPLFAL